MNYRVIVEYSFVVSADSDAEAMRIAPIAFHEAIDKEIKEFGQAVSFVVWPE